MKIRLDIIAALSALSCFGGFGTAQWTEHPNAAAVWPTSSTNAALRVGNLTALALVNDGTLERLYANNDVDTPSNINHAAFISPVPELLAKEDYEALLGGVNSVTQMENLFSSADTPEVPEYDLCNCANPASHGPENPHWFGRCAANLDCSGMIWTNAFDAAYSSNFFCDVNEAFEFGGAWQDPWGSTTWLDLARRKNAAVQSCEWRGYSQIAYLPILNALSLLPALDRTLSFDWYSTSDNPGDDHNADFAHEVKFYECQRTYYLVAPFDIGGVSMFAVTEYDETLCTNSVATNLSQKAVVCAYTRQEGPESGWMWASVQLEVSVGRPEHVTDEEWAEMNPTVGELASGGYELIDTWTDGGVTFKRYRDELTAPDGWDMGGFVNVDMPWRHVSSSVRTFYPRQYDIDDTEHLYPMVREMVVPEWRGHVAAAKSYVHLRGASTRREDDELVRNASNLHATVSGVNSTNVADSIIAKVNEYSGAEECDGSTAPYISVTVDGTGIELPEYAAVYMCSSDMDSAEKVYPSGIYYKYDGYFTIEQHTYDVLTFYPEIYTEHSGMSIEDTTSVKRHGRIDQIDWNFKSITK